MSEITCSKFLTRRSVSPLRMLPEEEIGTGQTHQDKVQDKVKDKDQDKAQDKVVAVSKARTPAMRRGQILRHKAARNREVARAVSLRRVHRCWKVRRV